MVSFVIVEDDDKCTKKVKNVINKFKYRINYDIKVYEFNGFNAELNYLINNRDKYTIYILDIELKNSKSGIEIASLIRKKDYDSEIIFITSHDNMFETVYRSINKVFDFIEKFYNFENRLYSDIKIILSKKIDYKLFSYKGRHKDFHIYLHSIQYIYHDKVTRKTIIVTDVTSIPISLTLKKILLMIDSRFKMVHRSCIINTEKVVCYDWYNKEIVLEDGKVIDWLSKNYKHELEQ